MRRRIDRHRASRPARWTTYEAYRDLDLSLIHIYSALPLNLHGQVCALYAVLWGGLSLIARPVYRLLKKAMMEQGPAHGQRISLHC